jgi:hypothetical protein
MGFGGTIKKGIGSIANLVPGASQAAELPGATALPGGVGTVASASRREQAKIDALGAGASPESTQEQITAANVFRQLTPEQQKDFLINNPNIVTPQGKQFFDPLTNTIRLEESEFQTGQRGRQEQLASELSGQLTGQTLPGTDPSARFEQGRELLQPAFTEERERLEQQLADQGIPPGTEAHQKELDRLERSQGTRLESLAFSSVQTTEAQRAARFNEISSLLGQQQVGGIGFGQFSPQVSGLDLFGAEQAQLGRIFQGEQSRLQRKSEKDAALIGAIGGLGGSAVGAALSDKTLKENIKEIGVSDSGIKIYEFEYINKQFGEGRYEGVMAQDLKESSPEAVTTLDNGILAVNYSKIDVDFRRVN